MDSKTSEPTKANGSTSVFSGSNASRTLSAVPVLQKVAPDEELQMKSEVVQKVAPEEEEPLQGKFATTQRQGLDEEEPLQGKFTVQREVEPEGELPIQGKFTTAQRQGVEEEEPLQMKPNNTGLPDNLKSGVENLSGYLMDDVKVHYNSSKPAQLQALAYAQGTDIHVAPGQEQHLPHEAWHVVQQKQGRVQPTMQMKEGVAVNDDKGLESEADVMGSTALQMKSKKTKSNTKHGFGFVDIWSETVVQRRVQAITNDSVYLRFNNNIQLQTNKKKDNNLSLLQLQKKHFPTCNENDPIVMKHKNVIAQVVEEIENRVDQARGMALNWTQLDFNNKGYLGQWARTANNYFNNPNEVPKFIHAHFGYAIETIACSNLPPEYAGLSIDFQVAEGHTRPDIVLTHTTDGEVGWLDITSNDSANHILGKDGAGWQNKPFVYEVFYNALSLPEVLTGLVDPVYKAWGEYLNIKNQIVQEEKEQKRIELRNRLLKLQEDEGWQTGIGDATTKKRLTKELLETLGVDLGKKSQQSTRGALAVSDISDGPYGYNVGDIRTDSHKVRKYISDQATPMIAERHAAVEINYIEYFQDDLTDYQNLPLVIAFYNYLLSENKDKLEVGTAVVTTLKEYDRLNEAQKCLGSITDTRAVTLLREIETWFGQLPQEMDFNILQAWSNKAVAISNQMNILTQVIVIEEQKQFFYYLQVKYGPLNFSSWTSQEYQIVQKLSLIPQNLSVVLFARQYKVDHPPQAQ